MRMRDSRRPEPQISEPQNDVPGLQSRYVGVPVTGRMRARLFAGRYDQQVDRGVRVVAGTPLAAHHARLASRREREDMALALTNVMGDAVLDGADGSPTRRVPVRADPVLQSSDVITEVVALLLGPLPVRIRGVARLRILLSDGRGPVYRAGPGTLPAAMRGVLAAM